METHSSIVLQLNCGCIPLNLLCTYCSHSDPTHSIFCHSLTVKACPTASFHPAHLVRVHTNEGGKKTFTNNWLHFSWSAGWPQRENSKRVNKRLFLICFTDVNHWEGFSLCFLHPFIPSHLQSHWLRPNRAALYLRTVSRYTTSFSCMYPPLAEKTLCLQSEYCWSMLMTLLLDYHC